MQNKNHKLSKTIILATIAIILLLLLIFSEDKNKNKINLLENTAQAQYTTAIGNQTYDITNAVADTANPPTLSAGMIPIKWDGTYWTITSVDDTTWYNYENGQPAYIMLNDGTYQSELIADMAGKKLAKDGVGAQIQEAELGSIYMWLPRYAYNSEGEIIYIKQGYDVAGSWKMPEIFMYEISNEERGDLSLAGIWIEYSPLSTANEVTTKINNMSGEQNKYGFIANTKPIAMATTEQIALQKYTDKLNSNVANNPIKDITNTTRTILKIINTNQIEPIKGKAVYSEEKVTVEITYCKSGIKQVLNENGKELTKISTNVYELGDLNDITYTYKVIDNENNIKELRINEKVYIIPNVETLNKFRDEVNAGNNFAGTTVIQTADIDMSSVCSETVGSWTPIGATGTSFAGTYNGGYNTISNLYINSNQYVYLGFFSQANSSTIVKNVVMENVYIYNTYNRISYIYTGAIIGKANDGTIENCGINSGSITDVTTIALGSSATYCNDVYIGGIIGGGSSNSILQCYNKATISGTTPSGTQNRTYAGGIIGIGTNTIIENCYNTGKVSAIGRRKYMCWRNCRNE